MPPVDPCPRCGSRHDADEACAADARIGTELAGRYRIERRLGAGGMGVVYAASHVSLGRSFAIKLLQPRLADDARRAKRFESEARAVAGLRHPNVVSVVDAGRDGESFFFVMELLDGEDCARLLRRIGPLPIHRAADIVCQAARGLAAAHAAGVVHRDLKPENLFVSRDGDGTDHVDVLDFGIAKLVGTELAISSTTGATPGTAYYMSPEQARGEGEVDARTDVWALGVVLYELLSGTRPFAGDTFLKVAYEILRSEPRPIEELRPEIPGGLAAIVRRAMHRDPAERIGAMTELASALGPHARPHASEENLCVDPSTTSPSATLPSVGADLRRAAAAASRSTRRPSVAREIAATALVVGAAEAAVFWSLSRGGAAPIAGPAASAGTPAPAGSAAEVAPVAPAAPPPELAAVAPSAGADAPAHGEAPAPRPRDAVATHPLRARADAPLAAPTASAPPPPSVIDTSNPYRRP